MNEEQIKTLIRILTVGSRVLATRLLLYMTMLLTFGLFAWAMYDPLPLRAITATVFALLVFWPTIRLDKETHHEKNEANQT